MLLSELETSWHKGVLWRSVDEWDALEYTCDGKDGRWSDLGVALLDALHEVLCSVIDSFNDVGVSLSVCGPHNDDLFEVVCSLEVCNVLLDVLDVCPLVFAWDQVVSSGALVGSDKVWIVDGRQWCVLSQLLGNLSLQIVLENLCSLHGLCEVDTADIPTTNHQITWVDHWKDIVEWYVNVLSLGIDTNLDSCSLGDGTVVVGLDWSSSSLKLNVSSVCVNDSSHGATVVASETDHHETSSWHFGVCLELYAGLGWGDLVLVANLLDGAVLVGVIGDDVAILNFSFVTLDGDLWTVRYSQRD